MKHIDKVIQDRNVDGKQQRLVFKDTLLSLMKDNSNIVVLDADLGQASRLIDIKDVYPQRFIECGIAEANMIGISAGLSVNGMIPFAHTFAPFATRRVFDQLYVSGAYAYNTINIFGSDPGFFANGNGGTHTSFEDIALIKSIPNSRIFDPADDTQFEWIIRQLETLKGINYIRSNRQPLKKIYADGTQFKLGEANIIHEGSDVLLITSGSLVNDCLIARDILKQEDISVEVVDMYNIKPLDKNTIIEESKGKKLVVTVENHSITNGLGSSVAETIADNGLAIKLYRHGINERFGQVGPVPFLQKEYELTAPQIASSIITEYRKCKESC